MGSRIMASTYDEDQGLAIVGRPQRGFACDNCKRRKSELMANSYATS
jgi:hypothetical protein